MEDFFAFRFSIFLRACCFWLSPFGAESMSMARVYQLAEDEFHLVSVVN